MIAQPTPRKMAARTLFSCSSREIASFYARINFPPHSVNYNVYKRGAHVMTKAENWKAKEDSALARYAWLGQLAWGISVRGDNVRVYTEPEEYYELVKV